MPWSISKSGCPASEPWAVIKDSDDSVAGCHATEQEAKDQMAALYASEERGTMSRLEEIWAKVRAIFEQEIERAWDGSASRWPDSSSFCSSCLIDVNAAAGRDEKVLSHCKLPVKSPGSDSYNFDGIKAAAGGHGITQVEKPSDVPQDAWSSAVKSAANTIISQYGANDAVAPDSVYEAAGKKAPERALSTIRLEEMIFGELMADPERWLWPVGVYLDGESVYAVVAEDGKLYRMAVEIEGEAVNLGEFVQVAEVHQPVGRTVVRQVGDVWRWFSVSATTVLNKWGEIDSRDLFDSFVDHAEKTGEYPVRDFYHSGEQFRIGQTDFLARDGNVLVTSGVYDDTEIARAEVAARQVEPDYWGDSIAYYAPGGPELMEIGEVDIPVYQAGIMQFISTVARADAASLHVRGNVQEVTRMLDKRALEAFVKLFGDDEEAAQSWLKDNVDETNRAIEEEGAITRAAEEPVEESVEESTEEPQAEAVERTIELDDEAISALVDRVAGSETFGDISASIESVGKEIAALADQFGELKARMTESDQETEERIAALERDDEEKEREWMADIPRRETVRVTHRPRVVNDPNRKPSLADTAESTLASMPSY